MARRLGWVLAALATAPVLLATPVPAAANGGQPVAAAVEVVRLTNAERAMAGCPALRVDPRLTAAAQGHAVDMATHNYFSHTSRDGRSFDRRIDDAGYPYPGGENIAKGQRTPSAVVAAWMRSPGHRTNILLCAFTTIGVGYDPRGPHWVQNFGY